MFKGQGDFSRKVSFGPKILWRDLAVGAHPRLYQSKWKTQLTIFVVDSFDSATVRQQARRLGGDDVRLARYGSPPVAERITGGALSSLSAFAARYPQSRKNIVCLLYFRFSYSNAIMFFFSYSVASVTFVYRMSVS